MSIVFNPLLLNGLQYLSAGGTTSWKGPVANTAALPTSGNVDGDTRVTLDTDKIWVWNAANSLWVNWDVNTSNIGSTPNANGFTFTPATASGLKQQYFQLQPANATYGGIVSTASQSFAGPKTFGSVIYANAGVDVAGGGFTTLALGADATTINIGNSGATVNIQGTTLYENVTQLQVTDPLITINKGGGAGSGANSGLEIEENSIITGYIETSSDRNSWQAKAPGVAGVITFSPGASGFTINQGSHDPVTFTAVGSTPNANGASLSSQTITLQPANGTNPGLLTAIAQTIGGAKTFTGAISASNLSGTNSGDVTLGTANGLSLVAQALSLGTASGSTTGALLSTDWTTFNNKVATSRLISTTSPLSGGGDLGADRTLSISQATTSTNGYLSSTDWNTFNGKVTPSAGDIQETSFTAADNQASPANITGFAFNTATVRSFNGLVSVTRGATYAVYNLFGIQKSGSWEFNQEAVGDDAGLVFSLSSAGQVQYTSTSTGSTGLVKFRAITTSV